MRITNSRRHMFRVSILSVVNEKHLLNLHSCRLSTLERIPFIKFYRNNQIVYFKLLIIVQEMEFYGNGVSKIKNIQIDEASITD